MLPLVLPVANGDFYISSTPHSITSSLPASRTAKKNGFYARVQSRFRRKVVRNRLVRIGFVTANLALLSAVVFFVLQARTSGANSPLTLKSSADQPVNNPLDQVSSSDIALTVSRLSGMTETTAIKNQSESDNVNLAAAPVTDNVVSKPQVISTSFVSNKDIQKYVVQPGDTVSSLASKFGVTSDSIRWSNGLTGDAVAAGKVLLIPPVGHSGIVYTVKAGDTIDSIAQKYNADKNTLITANDAETAGISVGEQIIILGGQQPVQRYTSNYYNSGGFAWGSSAVYGYNGYDYGYCTWWVANRRIQIGEPLPSNLGNASSWPYIGRYAGLPEGNTPRQYAAAVTSTYGEGHVAFVESVNADGSIVISEMNVSGWDVRDTRTVDAGTASHYIYIY